MLNHPKSLVEPGKVAYFKAKQDFLRALLICILCSGLTAVLLAQDDEIVYIDTLPRVMFNFYGEAALPQGTFKSNTERESGFGLGGEFLYRIRHNGPVFMGLGIHTFEFDNDAIEYEEEVDGVLFNTREKTASRLFHAGAVVRFQPEVNFVLQPYLQGIGGFNYFWTNTKLKDLDEDETFDRIHEGHSSVFTYGAQAGVQIVPNFYEIRADLRVGYLRNSSVEYQVINRELGDENSFPIDLFESKNSPIDLLTFQVGITFVLWTNY